ncbi:MAG: DUF4333 domain-containing protein [Actinomycetota bacterium]|nr:DUF4333 domain-containing protein [Actinomycetota bacterium]
MSDPGAPEQTGVPVPPSLRSVSTTDVAGRACPYPGPEDSSEAACPFPEAAATGRTSVCGYAGRGKRGYFIPGLIALIVLLAGGAFVNFGGLSHDTPSQLDGTNVATRIAQNYQANHQLESPPPVRCPNNEPVAAGLRFACQLLRPGAVPLSVDVTETRNGQITYRVTGAS